MPACGYEMACSRGAEHAVRHRENCRVLIGEFSEVLNGTSSLLLESFVESDVSHDA